MKTRLAISMLAILALSQVQGGPVTAVLADGPVTNESSPVDSGASEDYVPGRVLVGFKSGVPSDGAASSLGAQVNRVASLDPLSAGVVPVTRGSETQMVETLRAHPSVSFAELDYVVRVMSGPVDTESWNLSRINVQPAWDYVASSPGPIIAILDTGVNAAHVDLRGKVLPGYDFVGDGSNTNDDNGHGTHVAGIAAASADRVSAVAGVAPGSRILPLKVLNSAGNGSSSGLARAIVYAADHGAKIINLSLGITKSSAILQEAVRYAGSKGVLLVAAAGNSYQSNNQPIYPAAYPEAIAVAATSSTNMHASYSNSGSYVDIAAPGGDPVGEKDADPMHWITSTSWNGGSSHARMAGTSQASAQVAGVAALMLSVNPALGGDELKAMIESSAKDLGPSGKDDLYGYGLVDAGASVQAARSALKSPGTLRQPSPESISLLHVIYLPLASVRSEGGW
ncbi:MAG: S8 family serine peptidase [Dehalococcoidia bacterium]|nr:S8 family serine peptidase [Dehalococcoidia bacterium]